MQGDSRNCPRWHKLSSKKNNNDFYMYVDIRKLNQMHLKELEYLYTSVKKNWSAFPFPDAVIGTGY